MIGVALCLTVAAPSRAEVIRTETVAEAIAASGTVIEAALKGDETVDYVVSAAAGQVLSVDLSSTSPSLFFNILSQGAEEALFIGSTSGNVADILLPAAGNYVIRVYVMRNAARRDAGARYALGIGLAGADFADSLAGGPDWWEVSGLQNDALNVRAGPDTRYAVVGKARNGDTMQNRGCRMTAQTRWCSVRIDGSGVQGWVAGRYLSETAAPAKPEVAEGGPVGNGTSFDATGLVECGLVTDAAMRSCPFGVVRDGPGNAGVWIALGNGKERAILFEDGAPVSVDAGMPFDVKKSGDVFTITSGDERYRFPEALVTGG